MELRPESALGEAGRVSHAELLDASITVLIALVDLRGRVAYVNCASRALLGYEPEELVGHPADELIPPGLAAEAAHTFQTALTGRPRLSKRILVRRSDGTHAHLHSDLMPMLGPEREVSGVVVVAHVIDEGTHGHGASPAPAPESALIDRLPAVVYVAEPGERGRWRYVSPHIERLLGYSPSEWIEDQSLWADRLHPEDRQRVLEEESRDVVGDAPLASEYRLLTRDGQIVWVHDEAILLVDEGGDSYYDGLLTDITERKRFEFQLEYFADHDHLTGLCNRRRFMADLEVELKRRRSHGERTAILLFDLDGLKEVNDLLGHHIGDELLRRTAEATRSRLRDSDTVSRLGGDEFAAILRGADERHAAMVATELLEAIRSQSMSFVEELRGRSASAGIVEIPGDFRSAEEVLDARTGRCTRRKERAAAGWRPSRVATSSQAPIAELDRATFSSGEVPRILSACRRSAQLPPRLQHLRPAPNVARPAGHSRRDRADRQAPLLWPAWDGAIACPLGPANMNLTDAEFEAVLDRAWGVLAPGSLAPATSSEGSER